jgi:hypothetical protein
MQNNGDVLFQGLFYQILPRTFIYCHFACHSAMPFGSLADFCQPHYREVGEISTVGARDEEEMQLNRIEPSRGENNPTPLALCKGIAKNLMVLHVF